MNPLSFADPAFLFCFAPVVLTLYFLLPGAWRNGFLLASSLLLYAWGEGRNAGVLLLSIALNHRFGIWIDRALEHRKSVLAAGIAANVLLLVIFKYAGFLAVNAAPVVLWMGLPAITVPKVKLPAGLSFFTFMAISYLADVYRRDAGPEKSLGRFALYLSLFPHLIAGPIVRFADIAGQLRSRTSTMADRVEGARRFVIGLGKKVLIGNTVAPAADAIFGLSAARLSAPLAWVGVLCYAIQIYFDFSGYSDMAIGLARMFGFRFPENFNHPYVSTSISEFWLRWHISLSTWLRDYLFFPLGVRGGRLQLYRNILIVFLLCGFWHGAAWHFVLWGVFHGVFLVFERAGLARLLVRAPTAFRHAYTLVVVMLGWVLFRSASLPGAGTYLAAMFGLSPAPFANGVATYLPLDVLLALAAGMLASVPIKSPALPKLGPWPAVEYASLAVVFLASLAFASAQTFKPFIYFRF